jgi:hypothetical protein
MIKVIDGFYDSVNGLKMGACEKESSLEENVVVLFIRSLSHVSETTVLKKKLILMLL